MPLQVHCFSINASALKRLPNSSVTPKQTTTRNLPLARSAQSWFYSSDGVLAVQSAGELEFSRSETPTFRYRTTTRPRIRLGLSTPPGHREEGIARYWTVAPQLQTYLPQSNKSRPAAWDYPQPQESFSQIANPIAFYPSLVECFVDNDRVTPRLDHV